MKSENENVIGNRMKELRGATSQHQAAAGVGIKAANWNVYEKGQSLPGARVIIKLCQYYGVSADWLLGLADVRDVAQITTSTQAQESLGRSPVCGVALTPQSDPDLVAEIRALKARVAALESQPTFACG